MYVIYLQVLTTTDLTFFGILKLPSEVVDFWDFGPLEVLRLWFLGLASGMNTLRAGDALDERLLEFLMVALIGL